MSVLRGPERFGPWPGGSAVSVSLTFDVDAEAALLGLGLEEARSYSAFSERRFGIARGLPRILGLLEQHDIKGTFYIPGYTAERYADEVSAIVEGGHEVAHHGYRHRAPAGLALAELREEIERGIAALVALTGSPPEGYRSPSWNVDHQTVAELAGRGFAYDSSCMGDDGPYLEQLGEISILELPVHWSLDDFPYYGWSERGGGLLSDPAVVSAVWSAEFRQALAEGGQVTYTAHPEITGRRSRFEAFARVIDEMRNTPGVWFATHAELARHVRPQLERAPSDAAPASAGAGA